MHAMDEKDEARPKRNGGDVPEVKDKTPPVAVEPELAPAGEGGEAPAEEAEAPPAAVEEAGPSPEAAEAAELKDRLLRTLAEMENLRKRAAREVEETSKYAITGFARDLLTIADNLRRALDSIPEEARAENGLLKTIAEGVAMTERELLALFERYGIRKIEPLGEPFDYNFHQAIFEVADSGKPAGTVVQVVQPGYLIGERLLRPAMVAVAKEPAAGNGPGKRLDTTA